MLFREATLADGRKRDVRVREGRIDAVATPETLEGTPVVDAAGHRLLPGMVDVHVHFRQPGGAHKETWTTGSRSAAAGGVTTVVDQPNTDPPTVTGAAYDEKARIAGASLVDYGINGGVTPGWEPDGLFERPLFALGEVFLADSTGDMGIDADCFADAVRRAASEDVPVTVHAEDADLFDESARGREDADAWSAYRTPEAEVAAVERAAEVAADADAQVHVAHTSTPAGVDVAAEEGMTCEATPHHLLLSREDYDRLGTLGRMNPPLRSEEHRAGLFERFADGRVTMVATDHAPHTRAEKDAGIWEAPSGVPGVETALALFLACARRGEVSYERVREATATAPAETFGVKRTGRVREGYDADLVLAEAESRPIRGSELHSRCGWTPFEGFEGVFPALTLCRGEVAYAAGGARERLPDAVVPGGDGAYFGDAAGQNVRRRPESA